MDEKNKAQQEQLSEKNRNFLEKWKIAREEFQNLPPEEQKRIDSLARKLFNKATLNGRIE